ncbi:MAG: type II secretion system protein [Gemmatimonadota bacterium]
MYSILRDRRGFTMIEMVIVVLIMGAMAAVAVPRAMRTTPQQEVHGAARQIMRDLESARMRAIATKRVVRLSFDQANEFYAAFLDVTAEHSGDISETVQEARASRFLARGSNGGIPGAELATHVKFGSGQATTGPLGGSISDAIAFQNDRCEFDARGMVRPVAGVRTGGAIFVTHERDASVVAAVTVSGSGAFRTWDYRDGKWR